MSGAEAPWPPDAGAGREAPGRRRPWPSAFPQLCPPQGASRSGAWARGRRVGRRGPRFHVVNDKISASRAPGLAEPPPEGLSSGNCKKQRGGRDRIRSSPLQRLGKGGCPGKTKLVPGASPPQGRRDPHARALRSPEPSAGRLGRPWAVSLRNAPGVAGAPGTVE